MRLFIEREGYKIKIEDPYDLWLLYRILKRKKFEVGCMSFRVIKIDSKEKKVKAFIWIEGEKIKLEKDKIRITGRIKNSSNEEIPLGLYHSIDITIGNSYELKIELSNWEINLIRKTAIPKKKIIITIFEYGDTLIYELSNKLKKIDEIKKNIPGKDDPNYSKRREQYLNEVIKRLKEFKDFLIIGAHSVDIDNLKKKINAKFIPVGNTGERGVYEIIHRGIIKEIENENRISNEVLKVNEFLKKIGSNEVVYGEDEVRKAVEWRSAKEVLVNISALFEDERIQRIVEEAEKNKIHVEVISEDHELGEQFKNFKIAAFLRYTI